LTPIRTERLVLRPWRDEDLAPFAALSADPEVMAYYPKTLDLAESAAFIERAKAGMAARGYGLMAVEVPGDTEFVGYVGLSVPTWEAHFTPCVEIGWRLAQAHWGRGYAFEAARAALEFGFREHGLEAIIAFTVPANVRSWGLMERLGMSRRVEDDFDHPNLPCGHRLRRHVLYRARRSEWVTRHFPDNAVSPGVAG
jgi:RimJ/RimL family protein N-acetyltransferase